MPSSLGGYARNSFESLRISALAESSAKLACVLLNAAFCTNNFTIAGRLAMANTALLLKLRELHEDLASINDNLDSYEQIDEATIDALGDLISDVSEFVDQAKAAAEQNAVPSEHQDLHDRVMEFESRHPRVTRFLSQVTDMLAMMGI